ncbi:unnamed protein product, partial [Linum tenue]
PPLTSSIPSPGSSRSTAAFATDRDTNDDPIPFLGLRHSRPPSPSSSEQQATNSSPNLKIRKNDKTSSPWTWSFWR